MSSDLTGILFFFLYYYYYYYYYFFLFPSFCDFRPSWSFLTSWIGPSFVKAHDLSLLFMEWVFLWNFGPQQEFSIKIFVDICFCYLFIIIIFYCPGKTSVICPFPQTAPTDTSRDQWIKCFDFGELRMVAEGLQNKYQLRRKVGVNRPNTLRWLS